jgi:SpoVK/Ycf46/Vps4 family AAA+-type ATPase
MARGELIRQLFSSYSKHDDHTFRAVALEIVAEEQQKKNHALARDLLNLMDNPSELRIPTPVAITESLPHDAERKALLVDVRQPSRKLSDIVLRDSARQQLNRIIDENRRAELLRVHRLRPKTKLLLHGPPGCGKSLCAEIIASELRLPLMYTRFDAIVSSYLGETSANLRKVFDYARGGRWVVLFDEFDAIGKSRDDPGEHGELKRVVNSFLQLLDGFDEPSLIIAATNYAGALDHALWRRFDEVLHFGLPTEKDVELLLRLKLRGFPQKGISPRNAAKKLVGFSHADVEWVCVEAVKTAILHDSSEVDSRCLNEAIRRLQKRSSEKLSSQASRSK